jgi:signal transduction histidine kinase
MGRGLPLRIIERCDVRPVIAWHRRLHVRLTAAVLLLLVLLAAALLAAARRQAALDALEATQRLQLGLARTIAAQQPRPLIDADGRPDRALLADMAMHVMALNPALEVYLLDTEGRVIGHALDGTGTIAERVDLSVVRPLAARDRAPPPLPLLGDDPRRPGARNVVSVEGLSSQGRMTGYLYVVLQGQTQQAMAAAVAQSSAWRDLSLIALLATLGAALLLVLATKMLTRPLRRLTDEVSAFHAGADDAPSGAAAPGDEVDALRDATRAMQQRIAQQLQHLQDNDRLKRELLSNISHDLHTPLANVQGYVETLLLAGDQLDAAAREQHLLTAMRHLKRLHRRIADLFELSKLDAGQVQPRIEPFRLGELLQDVVQDGQLAARERGVRLALAADSPAAQARVRADIGLIERVLQNLIDNALHHTPRGGSITLAIEPDGASALRVAVIDTGSGIAREHLPHIFERYWRADDAPAQAGHGASAGLGLAIVKRILDLHGSAVQVRSEPAHGTRFEFSLPHAA